MPRFYFHIRDGAGLIRDEQGAECASVSEAHNEGTKLAQCMASDMHEIGAVVDSQTIEVADQNGIVVVSVSLRDHVSDLHADL